MITADDNIISLDKRSSIRIHRLDLFYSLSFEACPTASLVLPLDLHCRCRLLPHSRGGLLSITVVGRGLLSVLSGRLGLWWWWCRLVLTVLCLLLALVLGHPDEPVEEDGTKDIEDDVRPHKTKVSPSVTVVEADGAEELVGLAQGAKVALASGVGVLEVSTSGRGVGGHVITASLTVWCDELDELGLGTCSWRIGDGGGDDALDQVGERRDSVHEVPEAGHTLVLDQDKKIRQSENINWAMLPAVSAESMAATMKTEKVPVNKKKANTNNHMRNPRMLTVSVQVAFR